MAKKTDTNAKQARKKTRVSEKFIEPAIQSSESIKEKVAKHRNIWVLIIFLLLLGVFLYFAKSFFVVAVVNGTPIYRLSLISQLEKTGGKTALDSLINKTLIEQEASKGNIKVTDAEVQAELEKIKQDLVAQGMSLDTALSAQGMTVQDFEENLRMKQTVEKLLNDNLQISDDDVKKYFQENKTLYGEGAKFEDLEVSIREQLKSEKLSTEFQTWYNKLKEESDIKYFLNF